MSNNDLNISGEMTPVLDAALTSELARLLTEYMAGVEDSYAPRLRREADSDHLAEVIGDHYAYRVLRRAGFVPGESGLLWWRAARTSNPAEITHLEELDVDAVAPALRRAVKALDPAGWLAPLAKGAEAWN